MKNKMLILIAAFLFLARLQPLCASTVTFSATAASGATVDVTTQPNFGQFYQNDTTAVTLTMDTDGTLGGNSSHVTYVGGSGATNGVISITGGGGGSGNVSVTVSGPAASTGDFNVANGGNNLTGRLYYNASPNPGGSQGTLITNLAFPCILSSGTCTLYIGAQLDIPSSTVATGSYVSSNMTVTASY